jgi:hypothetical protein
MTEKRHKYVVFNYWQLLVHKRSLCSSPNYHQVISFRKYSRQHRFLTLNFCKRRARTSTSCIVVVAMRYLQKVDFKILYILLYRRGIIYSYVWRKSPLFTAVIFGSSHPSRDDSVVEPQCFIAVPVQVPVPVPVPVHTLEKFWSWLRLPSQFRLRFRHRVGSVLSVSPVVGTGTPPPL